MGAGVSFGIVVDMVTVECCNSGCRMVFAMTAEFNKDRLQRRKNDSTFYCPRGHPQHYTGESEETLLRRERDRLKQNAAYLEERRREANERADHEAARARGYKGYAAKVAKRVRVGVCPCCRRSFEDLARHMASKHPKFGEALSSPDAEPILTENNAGSHAALTATKTDATRVASKGEG